MRQKHYSNIVKYYYNLKEYILFLNIFKNVIFSCDAKLNFQQSIQCQMTYLRNHYPESFQTIVFLKILQNIP